MDDEYSDLDDELYHHGILGMKWGVRRFQNEDGSYTNVGRKHHADTERADYQEDNPNSKPRKGINKDTVKKAAIIAGIAVGTVAVGYALHKTGLDRKGAEAIAVALKKGLGKIPSSQAKAASKAPSQAMQDIVNANKQFSKASNISNVGKQAKKLEKAASVANAKTAKAAEKAAQEVAKSQMSPIQRAATNFNKTKQTAAKVYSVAAPIKNYSDGVRQGYAMEAAKAQNASSTSQTPKTTKTPQTPKLSSSSNSGSSNNKNSKRYSKATNNAVRTSASVSTTSSDFRNQANSYTNFTDQLIAQMR